MSRCTLRRSDERIFLAGNEFFGNSGLHSSRRARGAYDLHHPGILKQREQVTERPEQATKVSSCFCTTRQWYITRRKVIQQKEHTDVLPTQIFPPRAVCSLVFVAFLNRQCVVARKKKFRQTSSECWIPAVITFETTRRRVSNHFLINHPPFSHWLEQP